MKRSRSVAPSGTGRGRLLSETDGGAEALTASAAASPAARDCGVVKYFWKKRSSTMTFDNASLSDKPAQLTWLHTSLRASHSKSRIDDHVGL